MDFKICLKINEWINIYTPNLCKTKKNVYRIYFWIWRDVFFSSFSFLIQTYQIIIGIFVKNFTRKLSYEIDNVGQSLKHVHVMFTKCFYINYNRRKKIASFNFFVFAFTISFTIYTIYYSTDYSKKSNLILKYRKIAKVMIAFVRDCRV